MEILENASLKAYNTFGIEVKAAKMVRFSSSADLKEIFKNEELKAMPLLILGGGSNLLLTSDFDGLVLKNEVPGIELVNEDDKHFYVNSGAGENWHEFVMHCIENGWAGLENLSLIPGNVGASPMQNIGAYGVEVKDRFHELEAFNLETLKTEKFDAEACQFGYRESVFKRRLKNKYIIVSVTFRLFKQPQLNTSYGAIQGELNSLGIHEPNIADVSQAVINIRSSKLPDPKVIGNAGSFFKNPIVTEAVYQRLVEQNPSMPFYPSAEGKFKLAAGWLIEKSGWKGFLRENYGVHAKQALVLVNHGGATGKEIYDLSTEILEDVKKKFGVELEREVNII
ncbi:UDP-N-acetylmuramate dehydrogenase [Cryomorphaceae bacterium 1068]|nr:UDP-N-acetylmuramate dehydrogenase [Cryomorphaceae bacterium 1068]